MCQDLEAEEAMRTQVTGKPMKSRDTVQTLPGLKLVGSLNTLYFKFLVAKGLKSHLNFIYISHRLILRLGPLTLPIIDHELRHGQASVFTMTQSAASPLQEARVMSQADLSLKGVKVFP